MKVVPFTEEHIPQLFQWFDQWDWNKQILDLLPPTGLIIENTAAIFLYYTNSKLCFVESFIANKETSKEFRNEALNELVKAAKELVSKQGFRYMVGYTTQPMVEDRAIKHGFIVSHTPYHLFYQDLGE